MRAVFDSWDSPRAQVYRRTYEIPDDLGTAVNVVQMVFGNKGDGSGTGVCFTRDPSTGESRLYGEFLQNAQGEDVVAGIRTPEPIERMNELLPEAYAQLLDDDSPARGALPRHAGHRVHGRGGEALPAPDAHGEANRGGGAPCGGRDGRRGADLEGGGGRAHRPGSARPAAAPDDRPDRRRQGRREGLERLARSRVRARSSSTPTPRRRAARRGRA